MSRQDTTILNPLFAVEQILYIEQTQYIEGYNTRKPKKTLTFERIKKAVEMVCGIKDISTRTRVQKYPDARKMFALLSYDHHQQNKGVIMDLLKMKRSSFYHTYNQATILKSIDKDFQKKYIELKEILSIC